MSKYTKEQIAQADSMDLVSYLESRGYELMRQGSQYRLKEHDSLYVKGNQWYWHSQHKGGKTLDFLIDYEGMSFLDAMKALIGEDGKTERRLPIVAPLEHPDPKELKLPEPAENNNAVYAYLKSRGIDARIIKECIDQGLLYQTNMFWVQNESGEFEKKACPPQAVFVGKDMDGTPRYACTRSCTGQAKHDAYGSDKAFAFAVPDGDSKALWVFESACDLLAHMTLCGYSKKQYPAHRVSLGGIAPAAMLQYLADHPQIQYVNLALDADQQGRMATEAIKALLKDKLTVYDHPPMLGKDYNEDLLARQQRFQEKKRQTPQKER